MSSISIRPPALSRDMGKGEQCREEKKISLNNYDEKVEGFTFRGAYLELTKAVYLGLVEKGSLFWCI